MKMRELLEDSFIVEWFDTINSSDRTQKHYLSAMQIYTKFTGKTPVELINEAEKEIKDGILPRTRKIKKYLTGFRKHLQDSDLAEKTVQGYVSAVRSFYAAFEIDIPKLQKSEKTVTILEENVPIPTKADLQATIKVCDVMEKAILLIGVSSGLSSNEIIKLKVKDFTKGYDPETKITTLSLRRAKVRFDFITFLSPEASQSVLDYLDYRNRKAKSRKEERNNQLEKQKVFSENDYLLCKQRIPNSFLKTHDEKERQLKRDLFMKIYRTISEKAGKNSSEGHWNLIRSHNMRRYFNSALLNAGCDSFHVEYFMGHKLNATQAAYFRASPEKLRELYLKFVPYLTIQKEADVSESAEYKRIKHDNEILAAETARHVVERSELQDLRTELNEMKEFEKIFKNEISRLRENFENPKTEADKIMADHRKRMANDAGYRDEFNRNNITLKPKKEIKEVTNEDYKDPRYWDYESRNS
jgi:integrase